MSKIIAHIDLNMFFVRCEILKDPSLEGKCVAIGHEGRSGIISTCSYEARKFGVHSGMPTFQATKLCPHLILKSGDYRFYRVMSHAFFHVVERYTKIIEKASIDECYADFTDALKDVKDVIGYFKALQNNLYKETGLMCSIGIAPTKFLAKMGSDYKKPMGITIVRKRDVPKLLYPLPVKDMYGIGKRSVPKLNQLGIKTIGDLMNRLENDKENMQKIFGKFYQYYYDALKGNTDDKVITERFDPKSIGNSTTLIHDTDQEDDIKPVIRDLSEEVSRRTKKENKVGTTISLTFKDVDFVSHSKSTSFKEPTDNADFIYETACRLYENNFKGMMIRLVGVTLSNLVHKKGLYVQMSLFDSGEPDESTQTKVLIDNLNRKAKKKLFKRASEVNEDDEN